MTLNFGHCRLPREETARTSLLAVDLKKTTTTTTTTIKWSTARGVIAWAMTNGRQRKFSKEKQPESYYKRSWRNINSLLNSSPGQDVVRRTALAYREMLEDSLCPFNNSSKFNWDIITKSLLVRSMLYHIAEHALQRANDFSSKSIPCHFVIEVSIKLKITCVRKLNNSLNYAVRRHKVLSFLSLSFENTCSISGF